MGPSNARRIYHSGRWMPGASSTSTERLRIQLLFVVQLSLGAFIDTDFGKVSVTLITPVGIRLRHCVIMSKLDMAR
jgi:hypothetical protein